MRIGLRSGWRCRGDVLKLLGGCVDMVRREPRAFNKIRFPEPMPPDNTTGHGSTSRGEPVAVTVHLDQSGTAESADRA